MEETRVHWTGKVDVQWAREYYRMSDIAAGIGEYGLILENTAAAANGQRGRFGVSGRSANQTECEANETGLVTTWQIEKFVHHEETRIFMGGGDAANATLTIEHKDGLMVKTVCTANKLLEKEVFDSQEIPMRLPFTPFYVKTSKNHPNGYSLPLMLELSQMFVNRMRAVMVKQAQKAISPQAFAILMAALGAGNKEEIERAFKEGGAAWLEGNDIVSVKEAVQAFPNTSQGVNNALAQVIGDEEAAMDKEGQAPDLGALRSARSAAGKHAHMAATDRPKGYAVMLLAEAQEDGSPTCSDSASFGSGRYPGVPRPSGSNTVASVPSTASAAAVTARSAYLWALSCSGVQPSSVICRRRSAAIRSAPDLWSGISRVEHVWNGFSTGAKKRRFHGRNADFGKGLPEHLLHAEYRSAGLQKFACVDLRDGKPGAP